MGFVELGAAGVERVELFCVANNEITNNAEKTCHKYLANSNRLATSKLVLTTKN